MCISQAGLSGLGDTNQAGPGGNGRFGIKRVMARQLMGLRRKTAPRPGLQLLNFGRTRVPEVCREQGRPEPELSPGSHGMRRTELLLRAAMPAPHPSGKRTLFWLPNLGRAEPPRTYGRPRAPRRPGEPRARITGARGPGRAQRLRSEASARAEPPGRLWAPTNPHQSQGSISPPNCNPQTLGWLTRFPLLLIPFEGSLLFIRPSTIRSPLSPDLLTRIRPDTPLAPLPENLIFFRSNSLFILPISYYYYCYYYDHYPFSGIGCPTDHRKWVRSTETSSWGKFRKLTV